MSLKTDFCGNLDTALVAAYTNGITFVDTTSLALLTTSFATASASGLKTFTVSLTITYLPTDIRLGGNLWLAFQSGMLSALAVEGIMNNEVTIALDTTDAVTLKTDLTFSF